MTHYQFASQSGIEYLEKMGDGDVFVLLHGISSGAYSWIKQLQDPRIKQRIIAWNAPGYGQSQPFEMVETSGSDYSAKLLEFVDELGLKTFTLVGHSLGAMMASAFAADYPERVSRLVLICPAQGYRHESLSTKSDVYARRPKLLAELGREGLANERGPYLLGDPNAENMAIVWTVSKGLTMQGFSGASHLLAFDHIDQSLPKVTGVIDLYYGEKDGITPPKGMFELQQKFGNIILHCVPNAGHLAYIDAPEYFKKKLFLRDQSDE